MSHIWTRGGKRKRIKVDANDTHFSKIIRFGHQRCLKCGRVKDLECAHILPRGHYETRFMFKPIKNGIHLCGHDHEWFDSHKITSLLFNPKKRVLNESEESYTFLVIKCGYTWKELRSLYETAMWAPRWQNYQFRKKEISKILRAELKRLEAAGVDESCYETDWSWVKTVDKKWQTLRL